jgi:hypothetical protein
MREHFRLWGDILSGVGPIFGCGNLSSRPDLSSAVFIFEDASDVALACIRPEQRGNRQK